jgi:hypothetical protein
VDRHAGDNHEAGHPEQRPEAVQELAIAVDVIRLLKNLEVAHQVTDDEAHKDQACDGHEDLAADGGAEESSDKVHRGKTWMGGGSKAVEKSDAAPRSKGTRSPPHA